MHGSELVFSPIVTEVSLTVIVISECDSSNYRYCKMIVSQGHDPNLNSLEDFVASANHANAT